MSALTRRDPRSLLPDLFGMFEAPFSVLRPFTARPIRLEDYVEDGHYVVRAEVPGMDPGKDVEVTVCGGVLAIRGERQERTETKHRSEFCYGAFSRQVRLPAGADEDHITATCDKGVLTVDVPLREKEKAKAAGRQIPVQANGRAAKN